MPIGLKQMKYIYPYQDIIMKDPIVNIRIFTWHFQLYDRFRIRIKRNTWHRGLPEGWFKVYRFFKYEAPIK